MEKTYEIKGMTCVICKANVEKIITSLDGVYKASVNLIENELTIDFDDKKVNESIFQKTLQENGFSIVKDHQKEDIKEKGKLLFCIILLLILMYFSMIQKTQTTLQWILCTLLLLLPFNHLKRGFLGLLHHHPNMESLIFVSCLAAYLYSLITLITKSNHHLYFESAAMVVTIVSLGKYIEGNTKSKATKVIRGLSTLIPMQANKLVNNDIQVIKIEDLRKKDIVRVFPGDSIPQDGIVINGFSSVDESLITGESLPQDKNIGSDVIGGTINLSGTLDIEITKTSSTSVIAKIINLSKTANSNKTPIIQSIDKIAKYFVSVVLIIALLTFVIWMCASNNIEQALHFALSVLVVSCPCALGLATPLSLAVAGGVASKLGILIKKPEVLEIADQTKNILFDKTGTLTSNKLEIIDVKELDKEFINILSSIEKNSLHPLAKTIVSKYPNGKIQFDKVEVIPSKGIKAKQNKDIYFAGRMNLEEQYQNKEADSSIVLTKNEQLLGIVYFKDVIRASSSNCLQELKTQDIQTMLVTGDNELAAKRLATKLSINYKAECSPIDKNNILEETKKEGITMMVGDGINDALAMNSADISCTIKEASDLASASSDIILMNNDLTNIPKFIALSKLTKKIIKQNLIWALGYNALFIPLASGILYQPFHIELSPMICSITMWISSMFVLLNALRINRFIKEKRK